MLSFGAAIDAEPTIDQAVARTVGARLQAVARRIGAETHPFSGCPGAPTTS